MLLTEPVIPIRQRRGEVPEPLAAVVHKALSREPNERCADVAAMRQELENVMAGGVA
jgi:hypothetical protein